MNSRFLNRSALVLGVLSSLIVTPVLAAGAQGDTILVLRDEGNNGPEFVQVQPSAPASAAVQAAATPQGSRASTEPEIVLRHEEMSAPEVIYH